MPSPLRGQYIGFLDDLFVDPKYRCQKIGEKLIGKFKSPDKVHFFSDLPKGPSGKIQRFKIQDKIK